MKKSMIIAAVVAVLLGLAACGDKNNDKVTLVGKWNTVRITMCDYGESPVTTKISDSGGSIAMVYEFKDDGTYIYSEKISGGWLTEEGIYVYGDGKLTITYINEKGKLDDPEDYEVRTLTKNALVLYWEDSYEDEEDGETYTEWAQLTLERI